MIRIAITACLRPGEAAGYFANVGNDGHYPPFAQA
jgi:hypothetical protein